MSEQFGCIGIAHFGWIPNVSAIIRIRIRRSVIPIEVHVAIVPIPTKANRTNNVRINEVGVNGAP